VTAIPVPHRDEFSDTMAFRLDGPAGRIVFCPDVDAWDRQPALLDSLIAGATAVFLDATFYDGRELPGRNLKEIPHPMMTDTMSRTAGLLEDRPGLVRFLHMNHTNPALWDSTLRKEIESRGFILAGEGDQLAF
jgi:pyrroloquinoline quinone biosynthesis protein B